MKVSQCAFVQYTQRSAAETAAEKTFNKIIVNGRRWNIKWGKSQAQMGMGGKDGTKLEGEEAHTNPVPGLPGGMPQACSHGETSSSVFPCFGLPQSDM